MKYLNSYGHFTSYLAIIVFPFACFHPTTQRPTCSWALKTIDLSRTTSWRRQSCLLLIWRMDTPQEESPTCSRNESTFNVPVICHTQRGWLVPGWYSRVISMAWMPQTPQQDRHHASIQSRIYPKTLFLRSLVRRSLSVKQRGCSLTPENETKRI